MTDDENPIKKSGPNLRASVDCVRAYYEMNIDLLTLANNHILDQGEEGVLSTI